jgi:hypothetical protein
MNVEVIKGDLSSRDADLSEVTEKMRSTRSLSDYLEGAQLKASRQTGKYQSKQGATITPIPCWAIDFKTSRRKVQQGYQRLPSKNEGKYVVGTADWAKKVAGTGTEKQKWRNVEISGPCSPSNVFSVVTSTYLVPFAIGHRYIVHIPAELNDSGTLDVRHDFCDYNNQSLSDWTDSEQTGGNSEIEQWTVKAQKIWDENKTQKSDDRVTERLNKYDGISNQSPRSYRVVHTRSRSFYAAVLDQRAETAMGLPYSSAKLQRRSEDAILDAEFIPIGGSICDNKLHVIETSSKHEAYWMTGLFNSEKFNNMVMKKASGEPPGIYTIPAKILSSLNLEFDPDSDVHLELAESAMKIEQIMSETIRNYMANNKSVPIDNLDDTDQSPDIPTMVYSAYTNRWDAETEVSRLNTIAEEIIGD